VQRRRIFQVKEADFIPVIKPVFSLRLVQYMLLNLFFRDIITEYTENKINYEYSRQIYGCLQIHLIKIGTKQTCQQISSNGTPYCNPMEIEIAKQFIMLRMVAPLFCISMNISPMYHTAYSPF
jgi:hypothetical protein